MRIAPIVPFALLASSCALLQPERRLAPADQGYRVGKLLVLPFSLTSRTCSEEIDQRARKEKLVDDLSAAAAKALRDRGYKVSSAPKGSAEREDARAFHGQLDKPLCAGEPLDHISPKVIAYLQAQAKRAGAAAVLFGGVSRLRWHLELADSQNGTAPSGNDASQFVVRAGAALYDVKTNRLVWTESVDTRIMTNSYEDAVSRIMLFAEPRSRDPHEKLFYDFPLPAPVPPTR